MALLRTVAVATVRNGSRRRTPLVPNAGLFVPDGRTGAVTTGAFGAGRAGSAATELCAARRQRTPVNATRLNIGREAGEPPCAGSLVILRGGPLFCSSSVISFRVKHGPAGSSGQ